MKKGILFVMAAFMFSMAGFAQRAKTAKITAATFEVNGVCGMCKNNIEKAAKAAGALTAAWDEEKHLLAVKYNPQRTTVLKIQQKVAGAGYDNAGATAAKEAYDKLHECCKYERKTTEPAN